MASSRAVQFIARNVAGSLLLLAVAAVGGPSFSLAAAPVVSAGVSIAGREGGEPRHQAQLEYLALESGWWGLHTGRIRRGSSESPFIGADLLAETPCRGVYSRISLGLSYFPGHLPARLATPLEFRIALGVGYRRGPASAALQFIHFSNGKALHRLPGTNGGEDFPTLTLSWRW